MWKFYDFSITQNLREINVGEFTNLNLQFIAILEALNFITLKNFRTYESAKIHKNENSGPQNVLKCQIL